MIVALIPARNEPEIGLTVDSVLRQTKPVDVIIVVTNNCSPDDTTADIARAHGAQVIELGTISGKKAGAMNRGLVVVQEQYPNAEFIIQMDADTILHESFVERTHAAMRANVRIGGLGASFVGRNKPTTNLFNRFLVWSQRQEFIRFHGGQLTKQTSVLSGTACLLRLKAAIELKDARGFVWDENCIVEDYEATKAMQKAGWLCMSDTSFIAYTDVMTTWDELIAQRLRWQFGTLQVVFRDYRGEPSARLDAWRQRIAYGMAIPHLLGYVALAVILMLTSVSPIPLIASWALFSAYNAWSIRKIGWKGALFGATIIPLELYNLIRYIWMWRSWTLYRKPIPASEQTW